MGNDIFIEEIDLIEKSQNGVPQQYMYNTVTGHHSTKNFKLKRDITPNL